MTIVLIAGILSAFAVFIGRLPNQRYAQLFYRLGSNCESCPLAEQMALAGKATYHDPSFSAGYTRLGFLYKLDNRVEEAASFHRQAIVYDPQNRSSLLELGIHNFQQEDLVHALEDLQRAEAIGGYGDTINYYLGRIHERNRDYARASWYYTRAYQFNPENLNALARLSTMDYKSGDKRGCLKVIEDIRQRGKPGLAAELEAFVRANGKAEFMASEK